MSRTSQPFRALCRGTFLIWQCSNYLETISPGGFTTSCISGRMVILLCAHAKADYLVPQGPAQPLPGLLVYDSLVPAPGVGTISERFQRKSNDMDHSFSVRNRRGKLASQDQTQSAHDAWVVAEG